MTSRQDGSLARGGNAPHDGCAMRAHLQFVAYGGRHQSGGRGEMLRVVDTKDGPQGVAVEPSGADDSVVIGRCSRREGGDGRGAVDGREGVGGGFEDAPLIEQTAESVCVEKGREGFHIVGTELVDGDVHHEPRGQLNGVNLCSVEDCQYDGKVSVHALYCCWMSGVRCFLPRTHPASEEQRECQNVHALGIALYEVADEEGKDAYEIECPEPMALALYAASDDGNEADERHRVEQQHLKVEAHGGMLREHHDRQNHSARSYQEQKHEVEEPECLVELALEERQEDDEDGKDDGACGGREGELFPDDVGERLDNGACFAHQLAASGLNDRLVEVLHQVVGKELLFADGAWAVGLEAQQQVGTHPEPGTAFVVLVNHLAQGRSSVGPVESCLPGHVAQDDVAGAGRAIVVIEIVAVGEVFVAAVLFDSLHEKQFLGGREVERLFDDAAFLVVVFGAKLIERGDAHHIVGAAEHEVQDEMGLVHVERAVVDGDVDGLVGVDVVDGRVAVDAVDLLSRLARQQSDMDGGVGMGEGGGIDKFVGGENLHTTPDEEQQNQELKP